MKNLILIINILYGMEVLEMLMDKRLDYIFYVLLINNEGK
jgi:hypothetical protein